MRTDGLGWTNTRKYTFIVWLRLGDLFVPLRHCIEQGGLADALSRQGAHQGAPA